MARIALPGWLNGLCLMPRMLRIGERSLTWMMFASSHLSVTIFKWVSSSHFCPQVASSWEKIAPSRWLSPRFLTCQTGFTWGLTWILTTSPPSTSPSSSHTSNSGARSKTGSRKIYRKILVFSRPISRRHFWLKIFYSQWRASREPISEEILWDYPLESTGKNFKLSLTLSSPLATSAWCSLSTRCCLCATTMTSFRSLWTSSLNSSMA